MKTKTLVNRKGRNAGCRSYAHAYTMAKLQQRKEHFMTIRNMRIYWNELNCPIYGPLNLMTRHLATQKL